MKYAIVTFGCRVNQADSLQIEDGLRRRGATEAHPDAADLVVVNTCSVTASADQGARQTIRRLARSNPDARIVVTGCYATRRPDEVRELPNVFEIVPNSGKDVLVETLDERFGLTTAQRFAGGDGPCGAGLEPGVAGRTALTLRVQTGCEERCSYCIIPATRGASRSRSIAAVEEEIRRAVAAGYKEIVITGVHLGSYGRAGGSSLTALIRRLADWEDDVLFRISSLEPMDCTPEIVDLVAGAPCLAHHFHLPLQHGADTMLRAMRRPYTVAYYEDLITYIRRAIPDASIGSDIIAGFPGERDEHFDEMCERLERLPLTHLHVFPYSDRPGTEASLSEDKVHGTEVRRRAKAIRAIGERLTAAFRHSQVGATLRALTVDDGRSAVTGNYLKVRIDEQRPRNEWVFVTIADGCLGQVVDDR